MPHSTPWVRPELNIDGAKITFVYPRPRQQAASQVWRELLGSMMAVAILLFLGTVFLAFAWEIPAREIQGRLTLSIMGGVFMVLTLLAAWWTWYRFHHRDWFMHKALDQVTAELSVEDRQLVRRFATGRAEVWPREKIEDIVVEQRTESSGGEANETFLVCDLRLILRAGGKVHLHGRAGPGTFEEQDMHWMAGELRRALQVPYRSPPVPIEGASLEKTVDGVTIHVPGKDAEAAWREDVWTSVYAAIGLSGFLFVVWACIHSRALFVEEIGAKAWQDSVFVLVCVPITAAFFGGLALMQYFNMVREVNAIADRTLRALGVRSGALFRRYASGREECWDGSDISAVRVERVKKSSQVQLHLKDGRTVHLFGSVPADEWNKLQREGLSWLALELARSLGLAAAAPDDTNLCEAITASPATHVVSSTTTDAPSTTHFRR